MKVGGKNTVFVPMYGAPYVRDLDNVRRYGSLEDLNNFHKLAYMLPALHSSSSICCEPMEIPVPKRHLHIIHSALKHSDKPFMGIVTSKERAEDVMKMAGIVFGEDYVKDNTVVVSITNCNSPLVWDSTMLDAMKVYAAHNQPVICAPFALCGASTPASAVGAVAQVNAEALAGVAFTQLIRAGSPVDLRPVHGDGRHEVRRAHGRHAGSRADDVSDGPAGAEVQAAVAHLGLPCRLEAQRRAGGL